MMSAVRRGEAQHSARIGGTGGPSGQVAETRVTQKARDAHLPGRINALQPRKPETGSELQRDGLLPVNRSVVVSSIYTEALILVRAEVSRLGQAAISIALKGQRPVRCRVGIERII